VRRALIIAAGWTLCGVLLAAQAHVSAAMRGEPIGWVRPLAIWLAWAWIWALLTPAILRLTARYPFGRARALRSVLVHVAGSVVAVLAEVRWSPTVFTGDQGWGVVNRSRFAVNGAGFSMNGAEIVAPAT
jgi:hypothetical protein